MRYYKCIVEDKKYVINLLLFYRVTNNVKYYSGKKDKENQSSAQRNNKAWWSKNPMSYDWNNKNKFPLYSLEWFDQLDKTEIYGHRLFDSDKPFTSNIIPINDIKGKKVLEIGCGMGFHSEILANYCGEYTGIDLTENAVKATKKRFELKGLKGKVINADAEKLPFPDNYFDFIWSWGVIHHSSSTGKCIKEISRVCKKEGEARIMVYNRDSTIAYIYFFFKHIFNLGVLKRSFDETLNISTDGYSARYYTVDQFSDLLHIFFNNVKTNIYALDSNIIPLPNSKLRSFILKFIPSKLIKKIQSRFGWFIFVIANNDKSAS